MLLKYFCGSSDSAISFSCVRSDGTLSKGVINEFYCGPLRRVR